MVYTSRTSSMDGIVSYHSTGSVKVDHRKRKRNRIRASCLNCYASKRKCDKKRPCTRCVRLGNTAFCIYETEEPGVPNRNQMDEIKQLRHRIVELEGIVRKTKEPFYGRFPRNETYSNSNTSALLRPKSHATYNNVPITTPNNNLPPKLESVVCSLNPSPIEYRPSNTNQTQQFSAVADSERAVYAAGISNDYHHTSLASPTSSSCFSCYEKSPSLLHYDSISTDFGSSSHKTSHGRGLSYPSSSTHTLPIENYSSSVIYHSPSYPTTEANCRCLKDPLSLAPLVNLGFALRSSLDAMEKVHARGPHCGLFSYLSFLENHIFSLKPSEGPRDSSSHSNGQDFPASAYTDSMMTSP